MDLHFLTHHKSLLLGLYNFPRKQQHQGATCWEMSLAPSSLRTQSKLQKGEAVCSLSQCSFAISPPSYVSKLKQVSHPISMLLLCRHSGFSSLPLHPLSPEPYCTVYSMQFDFIKCCLLPYCVLCTWRVKGMSSPLLFPAKCPVPQ